MPHTNMPEPYKWRQYRDLLPRGHWNTLNQLDILERVYTIKRQWLLSRPYSPNVPENQSEYSRLRYNNLLNENIGTYDDPTKQFKTVPLISPVKILPWVPHYKDSWYAFRPNIDAHVNTRRKLKKDGTESTEDYWTIGPRPYTGNDPIEREQYYRKYPERGAPFLMPSILQENWTEQNRDYVMEIYHPTEYANYKGINYPTGNDDDYRTTDAETQAYPQSEPPTPDPNYTEDGIGTDDYIGQDQGNQIEPEYQDFGGGPSGEDSTPLSETDNISDESTQNPDADYNDVPPMDA